MGGVWHPVWHLVWHTPPPPPAGGVAPVRMYPCGKAPRPARGPDDQPHRSARCLTHSSAPSWSSAASVPRAPGRGRACSPEANPVAVLVRDHTPNVYAAVGRLVRRRARRGRVPHGPISHQPVAHLVRPDGRQSRAPVQPSRVATFAYGGPGRRSSSGRSIPRSEPSRARPQNG